jgi:hypothetical protein
MNPLCTINRSVDESVAAGPVIVRRRRPGFFVSPHVASVERIAGVGDAVRRSRRKTVGNAGWQAVHDRPS